MNANRTAFWLAIFSVAYNVGEGVLSVLFASRDDSVALLGFGLDSFVESLSGTVMLWRFWDAGAKRREQRAARLVGITLVILACYVAYESMSTLIEREKHVPSLAAIVIASLSLIVMPTLFLLKRRTARVLGSSSLLADSKQTLACMLLSFVLLIGAGMNYAFTWWQADAAAGILIAGYLAWEGYETLAARQVCHC